MRGNGSQQCSWQWQGTSEARPDSCEPIFRVATEEGIGIMLDRTLNTER
jgi:hypothetical protein